MIDINKLRRLAEDQRWIGRWYDAGCETLMAERNGEHEEVAHPIPLGLVSYLTAVQPAAISELLDRLEAAESEAIEQARLNGMGSEREAALMAKLEAAEKGRDFAKVEIAFLHDDIHELTDERDTYKAAYNEWVDKTEWVQEEITRGDMPAKYLGMHRADVIKVEIYALRAKIEAMEKQEPAGEVVHNGESAGLYNILEQGTLLYTLPGAQTQPAPSVPVAALRPVIDWLRNGCDPQEAAKELELLIAAAPEAKP